MRTVMQVTVRVAGVIGVNTPDLPRAPVPPVQMLRAIFADTPIYIIQFQDRGVAEWVLTWDGRPHDAFIDLMFFVGNAALFLASDLASGITGDITYVDCGFNITGI